MAKGRGKRRSRKQAPRRRRRASKPSGRHARNIVCDKITRTCTIMGKPQSLAFSGSTYPDVPSVGGGYRSWWVFGLNLAYVIIQFLISTPLPTDFGRAIASRKDAAGNPVIPEKLKRMRKAVYNKPLGTACAFFIGVDELICDSRFPVMEGAIQFTVTENEKKEYWPYVGYGTFSPKVYLTYAAVQYSRYKIKSFSLTIESAVAAAKRVGQFFIGIDELPVDDTTTLYAVCGTSQSAPSKFSVQESMYTFSMVSGEKRSFSWKPTGAWTNWQELGTAISGADAKPSIDPGRGFAGSRPFLLMKVFFEAFAYSSEPDATSVLEDESNNWKLTFQAEVQLAGRTIVGSETTTSPPEFRMIRKHFVQTFPWKFAAGTGQQGKFHDADETYEAGGYLINDEALLMDLSDMVLE